MPPANMVCWKRSPWRETIPFTSRGAAIQLDSHEGCKDASERCAQGILTGAAEMVEQSGEREARLELGFLRVPVGIDGGKVLPLLR